MSNRYDDVATPSLLQIAANTTEALNEADFQGAADLVAELADRLDQAQTVQQLAAEGIGQRAPIALVLNGREIMQNIGASLAAYEDMTLNGYIVLEHQPPGDLDDEDAESMRLLLLQKVDMADVVCIENSEGIDEALLPVIDYAETHSKPVQYTDPDA